MVFNLAATFSQLALAADRGTPQGLRAACTHFQLAAGAFAFLKEQLAAKVGQATIDLRWETAGMLEKLMLAQVRREGGWRRDGGLSQEDCPVRLEPA